MQLLIRIWRFFRRSPGAATRAAFVIVGDKMRQRISGPAGRSEWGAGLYYAFLSHRFRREQHAILAGQRAFRQIDPARAASLPELRRNIHRLEKGLSMRPRRDLFAEDYIERTVALWIRARRGTALEYSELRWATDVLDAYFATVKDSPRIAAAREGWKSAPASEDEFAGDHARGVRVPYPAVRRPSAGISPELFMTLLQERRSVRWYQDRPVDPALIEHAIAAGSLAASACNRQPYRFVVISDPARAREAAALAGGTAGWGQQIPALLVVVGDLSCYPHERDRHVPYIDASLAVAQMLLALQTMGLSSCVINWPDVAEPDIAITKLLALAPYQRVIMLIAVGHADPDGLIPWSQKKPASVLTLLPGKCDVTCP